MYSLILRLRHFLFDKGWKKSRPTAIPSICVGNVAAGGTGKTPMTELIINTIQKGDIEAADAEIYGFCPQENNGPGKSIAVLSRGYKRRTKGFQVVPADGNASDYGDEPIQIKKKFPDVSVIVDADRNEAMSVLEDPSSLEGWKARKLKKVINREVSRPEIVILDDAYQHRSTKATKTMVLTTYDRPYFKDSLMPFGRLRDLPSRAEMADMIVVTKCPLFIGEEQKIAFVREMGYEYDPATCEALPLKKSARNRRAQALKVLFATTAYDQLKAVFPDADPRYTHSKQTVVVSGIADDSHMVYHLDSITQVVKHLKFSDHHNFSRSDIRSMESAVKAYPIAAVITTEKDAQRLVMSDVPAHVRSKLFYLPVRMQMLTAVEQSVLKNFLN